MTKEERMMRPAMDEARAELIRETWRDQRNRMGAKWNWRVHHVLVVPAPRAVPLLWAPPPSDDDLDDDRLEFRFETQRLYPDRMYRVVCEGLVVEQGAMASPKEPAR